MDAYRKRRQNNSEKLLGVAKELTKLGYMCYVNSDELKYNSVDLVYCMSGDTYTTFGFAEVPYRWYINSEYCGKIYGLQKASYDCPIKPEEVIKRFKTATKNNLWFVKSKGHELIKLDTDEVE